MTRPKVIVDDGGGFVDVGSGGATSRDLPPTKSPRVRSNSRWGVCPDLGVEGGSP